MQSARVRKERGQEDAVPLGWHRNAHENTLGNTLFCCNAEIA